MSTTIKHSAILLLILLSASSLWAEENVNGPGKTASYYKNVAAPCAAASSQISLNINNVRATLLNGGDMWWNLNDARYEVPKVDANSGVPSVHSLFAGAIWLGGIDAGGQLKVAAQTYRQSGNDFWPGPLDDLANTNDAVCESYDKHWVVFGSEIEAFLADPSIIPDNILGWPAKGNQNVRGANGALLNIQDDLAPFFDNDGDGLYDPTQGDYPVLSNACGAVYADQMIFWVYNDKGNIHTETGGQAIGVQVGALAFAFATSDEVNNMTFYKYDILNKANSPIGQFYMGQWVDADLGCFNNDYVGCDTTLGLGYAYNGTATDPDCASRGYGVSVPIVGVDYFEGPFADLGNGLDDDNDGLTDEGSDGIDNDGDGIADNPEEREKLGMSTFTYYNNDFSIQGNPETAVNFYNYMVGFWKDGSPFTSDQCDAYGGVVPTTYMFPSDPDGQGFPASWSECSCNNSPADRRWLQASGPFTLQPGARNFITVGVVWVRQSSQAGCAADIDLIRTADLKAQALFDNCFQLVDGPDAPDLVIRELDQELIISIVNPESSNNYKEGYDQADPIVKALAITNPQITDTTYTFQGYKLYQLKNGQVGADQLDDPTLARLVAQVDLKDGVANLVNKQFNTSLCGEIPTLEVEAENEGIKHSFQILADAFADEEQDLVNHKTYYFTAVAYAYNYYDLGTINQISTDCGLVPVRNDQKTPYLQGRRRFSVYSAIPHIEDAAYVGTTMNSEYGDMLDITRIQGSGNGGNDLELTEESVNNILTDGEFYGPVVYKGGNAPINVMIYDPFVVKQQDFTLYLLDTTSDGSFVDTVTNFMSERSTWMIVTSPKNDTIFGDNNITSSSEQLLTEYGISISFQQVDNVGFEWFNAPDDLGNIDSRISFDNEERPWLTGVADQATFSYLNWIRSGQYSEPTGSNAPAQPYKNFFDDHYVQHTEGTPPNTEQIYVFYDPLEQFEGMIGGTWAPYCLATNAINGELVSGANSIWPTIYTFGPAFPDTFRYEGTGTNNLYMNQPHNTLENLNSVDIVFTNDKSKWTRCVVVELGEDTTFNEGGSLKGHLRRHPSLDINGNVVGNDSTDFGRSWFPGYAINVETGERLNLMFGEDSNLGGENGNDLIWNPTEDELSPLNQVLFGGRHNIYVMDSRYDEGDSLHAYMTRNYNKVTLVGTGINRRLVNSLTDTVYDHIMWVTMPLVEDGFEIASWEEGLIPEGNTAKVQLRVRKPYAKFGTDVSVNDSLPTYFFSTEGYEVVNDQKEVAVDFLEEIRAVPNPYYAYSSYETSQLDNRIKIINLPATCTVSIFSIDGQLIRRFQRAVGPNTHDGAASGKDNLDSSVDWDLKNSTNIPISSGVYLIHVEAPGLGEKVIKWFGVLRPFDLNSF